MRRVFRNVVRWLAISAVVSGGTTLVAALTFNALDAPRKVALLDFGVRVMDRALAPYRHRVAFQPVFRQLERVAARGFGSGLDGPDASGEAAALVRYREFLGGPARVVVDAGAFEGEFSRSALAVLGDGLTRVHAFEPARPAFQELSRAFADDRRLTPVPQALGDVAGAADLRIDSSPKMNSLVALPGRSPEVVVRVPITTLDAYTRSVGIDRIDVLKLDIEGFELNALRGAHDLLARRAVRIVQFEYGGFSVANRVLLTDLVQVLGDFDVFRIVADGLVPVARARASGGAVVLLEPPTDGNFAAFLAAR